MTYSIVSDKTATYGKFNPLAKAQEQGIDVLTDRELFGLIVGSGTRTNTVEKISFELDSLFKAKELSQITVSDLLAISGIGESKAYQILASMTYHARRMNSKKKKIKEPKDIVNIFSKYIGEEQEHFVLLTLNGAHEVINEYVVTVGLVNMAPVAPREIFKRAVRDNATAIVMGHNHPSGIPAPSDEDKQITKRILQSANLMGIRLLDHIIVAENGYMSFKEHGLL